MPHARDKGTGCYAHGNWDKLCACGHPLGTHTAEVSHGERPCLNGDFGGNPPCSCMRFKPVRVKKPRKVIAL